jgi:hypothetical protein
MKCIDAVLSRPKDALCSYDGYLTGFMIPPGVVSEIMRRGESLGLPIEIGQDYFEFSFQGRDSNLFVVDFLRYLAQKLGTATGEIRCEITVDEPDPLFEFFKLRSGKLIVQKGHILRDSEIEAEVKESEPESGP